jgi:hypothetical protein
MPLPVDTSKLTVLCGAPPIAVTDRETGAHRTNQQGEFLYRAELIVMGCGRPQIVGVRTAKEPKAVTVGTPVSLTAFTVSTFTAKDGGTGVFYEADAIEPAKATREAS